MYISTKGILLRKIKYSESSILVKIFCEQCGTTTFIIKNAFSKKSKLNQSLFSNLALLELSFDFKPEKKILFLKDATQYYPYHNIPFSIEKNSILLFYNELFYKLLNQSGEDSVLYSLLEKNLIELDNETSIAPDFHIHFLVSLIQNLGIAPINNYSEKDCYFSLEENKFTSLYLDNKYHISKEASHYFFQLLSDLERTETPRKSIRNEMLTSLINYLRIHNEQVNEIESIKILSEVLREN